MRYLLHLTSSKNIAKILSEGLKPTKGYITGVFCTSAKDLKYWSRTTINSERLHNRNLLEALISQASNGENDISVFRISLDKIKDIRIREQGIVLEDTSAYRNFSQSISNEEVLSFMKIKNIDEEDVARSVLSTKKQIQYLREGLPLSDAKRLQQKKKAIEYVCPEIPVDSIELIGSTNIKGKDIATIFRELFSGQPELNSLKSWA